MELVVLLFSSCVPFPCLLFLTATSHFFTTCQPQPSLHLEESCIPPTQLLAAPFWTSSVFSTSYTFGLCCPVQVPSSLSPLSEVESLKQPPQPANHSSSSLLDAFLNCCSFLPWSWRLLVSGISPGSSDLILFLSSGFYGFLLLRDGLSLIPRSVNPLSLLTLSFQGMSTRDTELLGSGGTWQVQVEVKASYFPLSWVRVKEEEGLGRCRVMMITMMESSQIIWCLY